MTKRNGSVSFASSRNVQMEGWPVEWTCAATIVIIVIALTQIGHIFPSLIMGSCTTLSGMCTPVQCSCAKPLRKRELITQDAQACFQCISEFCPNVSKGDQTCTMTPCECEDPTWPKVEVLIDGQPCWQCMQPFVDLTIRVGGSDAGGCLTLPAQADTGLVRQQLVTTQHLSDCLAFRYDGARIANKIHNSSCLSWRAFGSQWGLEECDVHNRQMYFKQLVDPEGAAGQFPETYCSGRNSSEFCIEVAEHLCTEDDGRCSTEWCRCEDPTWTRQELQTLSGTPCFSCVPPMARCPSSPDTCAPGPCECRDASQVKVQVSPNGNGVSDDSTPCFWCQAMPKARNTEASALATFVLCIIVGLVGGCCVRKIREPSSRRHINGEPRPWSERWAEELEDSLGTLYEVFIDNPAELFRCVRPFLRRVGNVIGRALDHCDAFLEPYYCAIDEGQLMIWDKMVAQHECLVAAVSWLNAGFNNVIDSISGIFGPTTQDIEELEDSLKTGVQTSETSKPSTRPKNLSTKTKDSVKMRQDTMGPKVSHTRALEVAASIDAASSTNEGFEADGNMDSGDFSSWDPLGMSGDSSVLPPANEVIVPDELVMRLMCSRAMAHSTPPRPAPEDTRPPAAQSRVQRKLQQRRQALMQRGVVPPAVPATTALVETAPIDDSWIDELEQEELKAKTCSRKETRPSKTGRKRQAAASREAGLHEVEEHAPQALSEAVEMTSAQPNMDEAKEEPTHAGEEFSTLPSASSPDQVFEGELESPEKNKEGKQSDQNITAEDESSESNLSPYVVTQRLESSTLASQIENASPVVSATKSLSVDMSPASRQKKRVAVKSNPPEVAIDEIMIGCDDILDSSHTAKMQEVSDDAGVAGLKSCAYSDFAWQLSSGSDGTTQEPEAELPADIPSQSDSDDASRILNVAEGMQTQIAAALESMMAKKHMTHHKEQFPAMNVQGQVTCSHIETEELLGEAAHGLFLLAKASPEAVRECFLPLEAIREAKPAEELFPSDGVEVSAVKAQAEKAQGKKAKNKKAQIEKIQAENAPVEEKQGKHCEKQNTQVEKLQAKNAPTDKARAQKAHLESPSLSSRRDLSKQESHDSWQTVAKSKRETTKDQNECLPVQDKQLENPKRQGNVDNGSAHQTLTPKAQAMLPGVKLGSPAPLQKAEQCSKVTRGRAYSQVVAQWAKPQHATQKEPEAEQRAPSVEAGIDDASGLEDPPFVSTLGAGAPEFVPFCMMQQQLEESLCSKKRGRSKRRGNLPSATSGVNELGFAVGGLAAADPCFPLAGPIATLTISGISPEYTPDSFRKQLDSWGLIGTYNFFFMPTDAQNLMGLGYAFINFIDPSFAMFCIWILQENQFQGSVVPAEIQGFDNNVSHWSRYSNSKAFGSTPVVIPNPAPSQWAVNCVNSLFSPQFREQFHKTKLCAFHKRNRCEMGWACPFAHSQGELQPVPDLAKTKLCYNYFRGRCNDSQCKFAHGFQELRAAQMPCNPADVNHSWYQISLEECANYLEQNDLVQNPLAQDIQDIESLGLMQLLSVMQEKCGTAKTDSNCADDFNIEQKTASEFDDLDSAGEDQVQGTCTSPILGCGRGVALRVKGTFMEVVEVCEDQAVRQLSRSWSDGDLLYFRELTEESER